MPRHTFELSLRIRASKAEIQRYLTDITVMGPDHPLAIRYVELPPTALPDGTGLRHFQVTETFRLGFVPITTTYRVTTKLLPDGNVVNEAFQRPGVHLVVRYTLEDSPEGLMLFESTLVEGPWLLSRIALSQAQPAHRTLLDRMKTRLEAGPARPAGLD